MSIPFERLVADLKKNPDLLQELGEMTELDNAVRWARQRGYEVEPEELRAMIEGQRELSEDELEQAAGGDWGDGTPPPGGGGG